MSDYPSDSAMLMRKILDVQQELERFRHGSVTRTRDSSSKRQNGYSKPSPSKNRINGDSFNILGTKENRKSNMRLDLSTDQLPENYFSIRKSHSKKDNNFSSILNHSEAHEREGNLTQDYPPSKRPPTNPDKSYNSGLKDITTDLSNNHKNPDSQSSYKSSLARIAAGSERDYSSLSSSQNKQSNKPTYLSVSNIKKEKAQQQEQLHKSEILNPAQAIFSQLLSKANLMNFISQRDIENDKEIEKIYKSNLTPSAKKEQSRVSAPGSRNIQTSQSHKDISPISLKKPLPHVDLEKYSAGYMRKLEFNEDKAEESRVSHKPMRSSSEKRIIERYSVNPANGENKSFFKEKEERRTGDRYGKERESSSGVRASSKDSLRDYETAPPRQTHADKKISEITEKNELLNIIMELKNKIHSKELEILELKNSRVKNDMENQNLLLQIKDMISEGKRSEDCIEKLKQQIANQEKEIEALKKAKKSHEASKQEAETMIESQKIKRLEGVIEEKNKEILDLTAQVAKLKIEKKTALEEERNRCFHEIEDMKQELKKNENEFRKAMIELESHREKMKEYALIDRKLVELEEYQNKLIEENDNLRAQLNEKSKALKEYEKPEGFSEKDLINALISMSKKLREADEHSRKLMKMLHSSVRGEEVPIEIILKHNRTKETAKGANDNELRKLPVKDLTQHNLNAIDELNRNFVQCMDQICDEYASKYGNECNVQ